MLLRGKAPLRVSFAGGGTDVAPYCDDYGGAVLSSTVNLYAFATVEERQDSEVHIRSLDYDSFIKYDVRDGIRYDGRMDLLKAIIARMELKQGINIFIHNDAPPGSGLGSSGAIGSMIVSLIAQLQKRRLSRHQVADIAIEVERVQLGIPGGKQDQFASVFGGFNFMEFQKGQSVINSLRIDPMIVRELEYHLLLVYTKKTHYSGDLIKAQVDLYHDKDAAHLEGLHALKALAGNMKQSLLKGNMAEFGDLLHEAWMQKKRMNSLVSTSNIDELYDAARNMGARGGKILGAGGGGYILLFCPFNCKHLIAKRVEEMGSQVVPFSFEDHGLQVWSVNKSDVVSSGGKNILEVDEK